MMVLAADVTAGLAFMVSGAKYNIQESFGGRRCLISWAFYFRSHHGG